MKARMLSALMGGIIIALGATTSVRAAGVDKFTIGVEPSFFYGKYGTHHTFRIYDMPLSVAYQHNRLRMRIEVPYIALSGSGLVIGATAVSQGRTANFRSGFGDIWVEGEYELATARGWAPSLEPYVKIKIPTASYADGLGTGHPDEEFGGRLEWNVADRVFPFVRLGYRIIGKVPSLHLQNIVTFAPGATLVVTPRDYLTVLATGHTAVQAGHKPVASLVLAYNRRISTRWEFQSYVANGLTTASAAIGVGFGVLAHF